MIFRWYFMLISYLERIFSAKRRNRSLLHSKYPARALPGIRSAEDRYKGLPTREEAQLILNLYRWRAERSECVPPGK
jgi:hypothetical protein